MSTIMMLIMAAIIFFWQPPFRLPKKEQRLARPGILLWLLAGRIVFAILKTIIQNSGAGPAPAAAETHHIRWESAPQSF